MADPKARLQVIIDRQQAVLKLAQEEAARLARERVEVTEGETVLPNPPASPYQT